MNSVLFNVSDPALFSKVGPVQGKCFKCKTKIIGKTPAQLPWPRNPEDTDLPAHPSVPHLTMEFTIPLKSLSSVWGFFDVPLINCEVELD